MKTTSSMTNGYLRHFTRCTLAATIVIVASTALNIRPVFAQNFAAGHDTADRSGLSAGCDPYENQTLELPQVAGPALVGDPYLVGGSDLAAAPTLAPAPTEQMEPEPAPIGGGFLPELPRPPIEPSLDPAIPATSPMLTPPPGITARPGGGLYSPVR